MRRLWVIAALFLTFAPDVAAQSASPWNATISTERAAVSFEGLDHSWTTDRAQIAWSEPADGGWVGAVERVKRDSLVDVALSTRAYRRMGDWTLLAGGGGTPDAQFLYRAFAEAEVSRRVVGRLVASGGYRFLLFQAADIHQVQPALTWYHARGEVASRLFVTHNATRHRTTPALLLRTIYHVSPRLELSGGASFGDRIFDIAALPAGSARSRVGFASVRVGVTRRDSIEAGLTAAREDPAFRHRSFTLGYGRAF
jgi:YaiO family outer membrane protein